MASRYCKVSPPSPFINFSLPTKPNILRVAICSTKMLTSLHPISVLGKPHCLQFICEKSLGFQESSWKGHGQWAGLFAFRLSSCLQWRCNARKCSNYLSIKRIYATSEWWQSKKTVCVLNCHLSHYRLLHHTCITYLQGLLFYIYGGGCRTQGSHIHQEITGCMPNYD